jgi:hypothetical protein
MTLIPVTKPGRIKDAGGQMRISRKNAILPNPKRKASPPKGMTLISPITAVNRAVSANAILSAFLFVNV